MKLSEDTKGFLATLVAILMFLGILFLFSWWYVSMEDMGRSICDTPMGARDVRCMGYYGR